MCVYIHISMTKCHRYEWQIRSTLTALANGKRLENLWYVKQRICALFHFKQVFGRRFGGVENERQIFDNFHEFL